MLRVLDVADFEALEWQQRNSTDLHPNCAGTLISDRLVLTAASCVAFSFAVNAALIQDDFGVGFRNVFINPGFASPRAYNNIALIELNYGINSTSPPVCIADGADDISGMDATYEGYGYTTEGEYSETLKKESVTIIANDLCEEILQSNNSRNRINKKKIKDAFSIGLIDDILCTMGKYDEDTNTYSVSEEGKKMF